jgi:hypothetical protein
VFDSSSDSLLMALGTYRLADLAASKKTLANPDATALARRSAGSHQPTALRVTSHEPEARVIQQFLIGSGIASQVITLESSFTEVQVAQADKARAEALLVEPIPLLQPEEREAAASGKLILAPLHTEAEDIVPTQKTRQTPIWLLVAAAIVVTWLIILAALGILGIP